MSILDRGIRLERFRLHTMATDKEWVVPEQLRPQQRDLDFDLQPVLDSVVLLHAEIPDDAYTASFLGTDRVGQGVVIRAGERDLILTIGYLITEAESIWLTSHSGRVCEAHALGYDQASGFGLVLPLGPLDAPAMPRESSQTLTIGDDVLVIGHGGAGHSLHARLIARREFAGYWEYLLEEALFTAPPHPQWGGTALVGMDGRLRGIGSLFVQEAVEEQNFDANMFVPVDLLEPILADMVRTGRPAHTPRPWLGVYTAEQSDHVIVARLTRNGPAHRAGLQLGDAIVAVAGRPVMSMPQFFRSVWNMGAAGVDIPLTLTRGHESLRVNVHSGCRDDFLKKPQQH
jgi:S1-C subfamily serine protease